MEDTLQEEIQKLVDFLQPQNGQILDLNRVTNISVVNALWSILAGEKLPLGCEKMKPIIKALDNLLRLSEGPTSVVGNIIPFPQLILLPILRGMTKIRKLGQ